MKDITCPSCGKIHQKKPASKERCSHGALTIFAPGNCALCKKNPVGPPIVSLLCGHTLCQDDFCKLGGKLADDEEDEDEDSDDDSLPSLQQRNEDDSTSSRSVPLLINHHSSSEEEHSSDFDDESDDDEIPALEQRRDANRDDDSSLESDGMPGLLTRQDTEGDYSSDDDSDDSSYNMPNLNNGGNRAVDSDSDSDSLPDLMERANQDDTDTDDTTEYSDSDDDSVPQANRRVVQDSDSDASEDVPGLLCNARSVSSSDDSSDDSEQERTTRNNRRRRNNRRNRNRRNRRRNNRVRPVSPSPPPPEGMSRNEAGAIITTRIASCHRRNMAIKAKGLKMASIMTIQAYWRRFAVCNIFFTNVIARLQEGRRYRQNWARLLSKTKEDDFMDPKAGVSWASLKRTKYDISRVIEDEDDETFELLDNAAAVAATAKEDEIVEEGEKKDDDDEDVFVDAKEEEEKEEVEECSTMPTQSMDSIRLTKDVLKWLKNADSKFRGLFIRRIEQLAAGERSRILMKHLTGCKTTIYETYLEQKSGHRIIWTPCVEGGKPTILVWYVARHKKVSTYIQLIDESEKRSSRELVSASTLYDGETQVAEDAKRLDPNQILLDPLADTPLKLHCVRKDEMAQLATGEWTPPLRLTSDERVCVEKEGTVLLLGRSGTGKTICICNRMDFDRRRVDDGIPFKQLFIARSNRICHLVQDLTSDHDDRPYQEGVNLEAKYLQFRTFIKECNKRLPADNIVSTMTSANKVDYHRYKEEFYRPQIDAALDPIVIWTQIRTYMKGSIEAVQEGRWLEEDEYLALGKNRCVLTPDQRRIAYAAFQAYQQRLEDEGMWDDCDMAFAVLRNFARADIDLQHEIQYDRIYVDEVQDYTQAELAIFYRFCSQGSLFFAGDTAQSVVEGVTFRFDDLRSVAHTLYGGDRRYIPDKPLIVNVNFRSHKGILNLAAEILERIFTVFSGRDKKLPPDKGYYLGPRPGLFRNLDMEGLKSLMERNEGLVVLTHDEQVDGMKEALGGRGKLVLGIREAKGLEFPDVIIVNFFSGLAAEHNKPWKAMLMKKDHADLKPGYPELEAQLKLLYTAITRCSKRLFFAETERSYAGDAFKRWLTERNLAETQDASKVEKALTPDEWRSTGVDYCIYAETADSPESALVWLDRAMPCFDRVADGSLKSKTETHSASVKLRIDLESWEGKLDDEMESAIIKAAVACAEEGMLPELFKLLSKALPLFGSYTQEKLQTDVLEKIEDVVD